MKPFQHFLLYGALAMIAASAQAQQRAPSEAATAEQRLAEDLGLERLPRGTAVPTLGDIRNVATLLQTGSGNAARLDQQNPSTPINQAYVVQVGTANVLGLTQTGSRNSAFVLQNGSGNRAGYTQDGQNNSTTITQNGSQNKIQGVQGEADLLLEGNNNTMKITQKGDYNTVEGKIRENNRKYEITQYGSENKLIQVESTMQAPMGYNVEMRGRGINLTIEQGKVLPGMK